MALCQQIPLLLIVQLSSVLIGALLLSVDSLGRVRRSLQLTSIILGVTHEQLLYGAHIEDLFGDQADEQKQAEERHETALEATEVA